MSRKETATLVVALFVLGAIVRGFGVTASAFPLNDGGLFYQMVLDLERTWPSLPEVTSYNGIDAPFAYPPLGFYLGAALHGVLDIDVMRFIPLAAAVLTVPAMYLLARSITDSALHAVAATGIFTLMPRTFEWMTMGGGLTRAPGLLLALIALWLASRVLRGAGWQTAAWAGIAGGAVVLTHPQAALFTVLSGVVLASQARDRRVRARLAGAVGVACVIVMPWLLVVAARGDLGALLSAGGTQPGPLVGLLSLLSFEIAGSELFHVTGLLAAVGLLLSVARGRWRLPVWLAALMILDARGGGTYATIPASMLAGMAFIDVLIRPFWEAAPLSRSASMRRVRISAAGIVVAVGVLDAFGSQLAPSWPGVALTPPQRDAIRQSRQVAPDGEFLVVSGRFWATDATAEWFPTLSGAKSVATVQGYEWLGSAEFSRRARAAESLRACANAGATCLEAWAEASAIDFTHVFIPKGSLSGPFGDEDCCRGLRSLLARDDGYTAIHDGPGATIFERTDD